MRTELRIVIDETCPWRIAKELAARGYEDATSAHQLRATGLKDPEWFQLLAALSEEVVLVTYDNNMATEHGAALSQSGIALAVIDKEGRPEDMTEEQYWREIIHRHAHRFVNQEPGSLWRYRRRGRRRITLKGK